MNYIALGLLEEPVTKEGKTSSEDDEDEPRAVNNIFT